MGRFVDFVAWKRLPWLPLIAYHCVFSQMIVGIIGLELPMVSFRLATCCKVESFVTHYLSLPQMLGLLWEYIYELPPYLLSSHSMSRTAKLAPKGMKATALKEERMFFFNNFCFICIFAFPCCIIFLSFSRGCSFSL